MSSMNQLTVGFPIASSKVYRGMHWNISVDSVSSDTMPPIEPSTAPAMLKWAKWGLSWIPRQVLATKDFLFFDVNSLTYGSTSSPDHPCLAFLNEMIF